MGFDGKKGSGQGIALSEFRKIINPFQQTYLERRVRDRLSVVKRH